MARRACATHRRSISDVKFYGRFVSSNQSSSSPSSSCAHFQRRREGTREKPMRDSRPSAAVVLKLNNSQIAPRGGTPAACESVNLPCCLLSRRLYVCVALGAHLSGYLDPPRLWTCTIRSSRKSADRFIGAKKRHFTDVESADFPRRGRKTWIMMTNA